MDRFSFHIEVIDNNEGKIFDTAYNCSDLHPVIEDLKLFASKLEELEEGK